MRSETEDTAQQDKSEVMDFAYQTFKRCRSLQPESVAIKRERQEHQRAQARQLADDQRHLQENAREHDAWVRRQASRAATDEEANRANGLVEVRVQPGAPFTAAWFDDHVRGRMPQLEPGDFEPGTGVNAILYALDRVEMSGLAGWAGVGSAVREHACRVMAGRVTTWVTPKVALERPEALVRRREDSFAGRQERRAQMLEYRLLTDDSFRAQRGLAPVEGTGHA